MSLGGAGRAGGAGRRGIAGAASGRAVGRTVQTDPWRPSARDFPRNYRRIWASLSWAAARSELLG